jgi:hypothetical protein
MQVESFSNLISFDENAILILDDRCIHMPNNVVPISAEMH